MNQGWQRVEQPQSDADIAEPWQAGLVIDGCKGAPVELGGNPGDQCKLRVTVLHGDLLQRNWSRL